jgi:hypothetical protein
MKRSYSALEDGSLLPDGEAAAALHTATTGDCCSMETDDTHAMGSLPAARITSPTSRGKRSCGAGAVGQALTEAELAAFLAPLRAPSIAGGVLAAFAELNGLLSGENASISGGECVRGSAFVL